MSSSLRVNVALKESLTKQAQETYVRGVDWTFVSVVLLDFACSVGSVALTLASARSAEDIDPLGSRFMYLAPRTNFNVRVPELERNGYALNPYDDVAFSLFSFFCDLVARFVASHSCARRFSYWALRKEREHVLINAGESFRHIQVCALVAAGARAGADVCCR